MNILKKSKLVKRFGKLFRALALTLTLPMLQVEAYGIALPSFEAAKTCFSSGWCATGWQAVKALATNTIVSHPIITASVGITAGLLQYYKPLGISASSLCSFTWKTSKTMLGFMYHYPTTSLVALTTIFSNLYFHSLGLQLPLVTLYHLVLQIYDYGPYCLAKSLELGSSHPCALSMTIAGAAAYLLANQFKSCYNKHAK